MTTLHRLLTRVLVAGLAAAGLTAASAAPVTGSVSSAGTICLGSTPTTPVGSACTHTDVFSLTYFDFINGALTPTQLTATPGQPGAFIFLTGSGDLMPLLGRQGLINDFSFPGPSQPLSTFSAVNPLWTAVGSDGLTYTYALSTLTGIDRNASLDTLDLRGTGTLCRNGIDCNLFSFVFTTQNAELSIRTTFSLSQAGFPSQVPEPGSLALLGLGLTGLVFGVRRRRQK